MPTSSREGRRQKPPPPPNQARTTYHKGCMEMSNSIDPLNWPHNSAKYTTNEIKLGNISNHAPTGSIGNLVGLSTSKDGGSELD
eukprot:1975818-Amphidinium_carterae.2